MNNVVKNILTNPIKNALCTHLYKIGGLYSVYVKAFKVHIHTQMLQEWACSATLYYLLDIVITRKK